MKLKYDKYSEVQLVPTTKKKRNFMKTFFGPIYTDRVEYSDFTVF